MILYDERWEKAKEKSNQAFLDDKKIKLKLPKGWSEIFPLFAFCKICSYSINSLIGIQSPGKRSYYHKKCVYKSPLFIKMGGLTLNHE